ncbi:MAG: TlpA family protein disulfide reductase [Sphingobacterium sp.]|jgi:thiol-disulfide isomerase/thioredoxin|nr:TlpA family protein disulfide reductase [Sphingobacterium sp.]
MIKQILIGAVALCASLVGFSQEQNTRTRIQELVNNKDSIAVNKELEILSQGTNEDDLNVLMSFYRIKGNQAKADSTKTIAKTRFPKGAIAYNEAVGVFSRMQNYDEKKAFSGEIITNFSDNDLTYLYGLLADEAAKNADCITLKDAYNRIKDTPLGLNMTARIAESIMSSSHNEACLEEVFLDMKTQLNHHLAKQLIDETAPAMQLQDLQGNVVSLASLRGKTVILDFWATWCGPCVQSFPGMQKAVDHFDNDPDVVFLFINTSERTNEDRTATIKKFISDKNLSFTVLLDKKNPETNKYTASDDFGITGLPTKIIIDKNGRIRLRIIGSNGATAFITEEMKMIVDLVNKN